MGHWKKDTRHLIVSNLSFNCPMESLGKYSGCPKAEVKKKATITGSFFKKLL